MDIDNNTLGSNVHCKDIIIADNEKNAKMREFIKFIQQKTVSLNSIKKKFSEYKSILNDYIIYLRGIDKFTNYVGQPIYEDFKKKLKLDDSLFPVYNSANGDCLYNSISIILFSKEDLYY